MNTLKECKEKWLPTNAEIIAESESEDTYRVVTKKDKTYNLYRFFILDNEWVCSVDVGGLATAEDIIRYLFEASK